MDSSVQGLIRIYDVSKAENIFLYQSPIKFSRANDSGICAHPSLCHRGAVTIFICDVPDSSGGFLADGNYFPVAGRGIQRCDSHSRDADDRVCSIWVVSPWREHGGSPEATDRRT